jgi:hypothetical protein
MTAQPSYTITRALISVALGGLLALSGLPWWGALLVGGMAFAFFLWAPRGGRYVVKPRDGIAPLRRDERTKATRDQAARNAFSATMVALAAVTIYYGVIAPNDVPVTIPNAILALGLLTYSASDYWLRRS